MQDKLIKLIRRGGVLFLAVLFLFVPAITDNPYHLNVLIVTAQNCILALSLCLMLNVGQLSLAHAGFMAVGAYTCALLQTLVGVSFWIALPLGAVAAAIVAAVVGYPALRLKGLYFTILTLAVNQIIFTVLNSFWRDTLGGATGILGIPKPHLGSVDFSSQIPFYYLILLLLFFTIYISHRLWQSRFGLFSRAIGESDELAESVGMSLLRQKMMAFSISCFFAGLAGGFGSAYYSYICPLNYSIITSINVVIYAVVGGGITIAGPILGASGLTFIGEVAKRWGGFDPTVFGVIVILAVIFLPGGLSGWWTQKRLPNWMLVRKGRSG